MASSISKQRMIEILTDFEITLAKYIAQHSTKSPDKEVNFRNPA